MLAGPRTLRPLMEAAGRGLPRGRRRSRERARGDVLARLIDGAERDGARRLILSEEQFLGSLRDLIAGGTLYGDVIGRLAPLIMALDGRPVTVMLALRALPDFLVSAYGQVLRGWRYLPFDARMRARLLGLSRGWADVVEDIAEILPAGSAIRLWRYEDFGRIEDEVIAGLVGDWAGAHVRPFSGRPLPGPSGQAIETLEKLAMRRPPDPGTVRLVLERVSRTGGAEPFDPWSAEERAMLQARHHAELLRIAAMPVCSWIGLAPMRIAA